MGGSDRCTRCGANVPTILSSPPDDRNVWHRYRVRLHRRELRTVLRFSIFRREWLPKNPHDQVAETYTTLTLCDPCARDVLAFAQTPAGPVPGADKDGST